MFVTPSEKSLPIRRTVSLAHRWFHSRVYRHVVDQGEIPTEENLAALIGTSFRIASANMVFTSDLMTNYGYIKPKNLQLTSSTPLGDYRKVAGYLGFGDYIDEYVLPYFQAREPGLTREALIGRVSLKSIEAYLRQADKIALMHNADDLTLAPGELEYLRGLFGDRAKIYPAGGHCGNMDYRDNVAHMVDYFRP